MPTRNAIYNPCTNKRDPLDVAGRINDLVNCYVITFNAYMKERLPLVVIGIVLVAILFLAARELLKD